jgi:hypothetical protein
MRRAYHADSAPAEPSALATELDRTHAGAAARLREEMAETLTVLPLDLPPTLARTFRSTNAIESMISICRTHATNVKRWRGGWLGRELARWQWLTGRTRGLCSAGFPVGCATPVAICQRAPFPAPARRSVHAVLPHTAHRRSSPAVFGLTRQAL